MLLTYVVLLLLFFQFYLILLLSFSHLLHGPVFLYKKNADDKCGDIIYDVNIYY